MALPTYSEHLLPAHSSYLTKVLSAAGERIDSLPVPLKLLKRPMDVPVSYLPHLAFEYSVDVWGKTWPESARRAVADESIYLHQKKGTAYTLKQYVRFAGGTVTAVVKRPMKVFSGASLTKEQREAWLSTLPQIRLWQIRDNSAPSDWKAFLGSSSPGRMHSVDFCLGGGFAIPSTALERLANRARWVVGGVETDTTVHQDGTTYQLYVKADAGERVFCGDCSGEHYFLPSDAWTRVITVAPIARQPWRNPVGPLAEAVTSEPELVVVQGDGGASVFCDEPMGDCYFVPSTAPLRLYRRFAVVQPDTSNRSAAVQFMSDGSRYGFPAHTAEVSVSLPHAAPDFAAGEGICMPRTKFWLPHDPKPVNDLCDAVEASMRLSDRVLLDMGPKPQAVIGGKPVRIGIETAIIGGP